ncbi:pyrimidine 5'-nucleotidase [Pseudogulbenkiania sp. NH8B]|uniref:pyrimidine 5'-nucleotidase n=1 Tax=Pseudogulbenkiania sp. (strain NH8B) TaxID=748280 RepID=UPI0002279384|nr:pyrimidine 5'-nucleotidase [Pseudogulbenkiania sp. NH8B]BAK75278.1 pyrimidine 5'-nucleotidase [Pseudogulbenkiania sp. NH8B]
MKPTWIFDLDDTLHHASAAVFPHINRCMTEFIMRHLGMSEDSAAELRQRYWRQYGATLKGLEQHHGIAPQTFLRDTHPMSELETLLVWQAQTAALLRRLPGRKILLSNGPQHYVEGVLRRMRIRRHFASVYGVERLDLQPKPHPRSFRTVLQREGLDPARCIMVEDSLANLKAAKRLGMRTVWISPSARRPSYVDVHVRQLGELLRLGLQ